MFTKIMSKVSRLLVAGRVDIDKDDEDNLLCGLVDGGGNLIGLNFTAKFSDLHADAGKKIQKTSKILGQDTSMPCYDKFNLTDMYYF